MLKRHYLVYFVLSSNSCTSSYWPADVTSVHSAKGLGLMTLFLDTVKEKL